MRVDKARRNAVLCGLNPILHMKLPIQEGGGGAAGEEGELSIRNQKPTISISDPSPTTKEKRKKRS